MCALRSVLLADRGVVRVSGSDAASFMQSLITNDMALLESHDAIHAGLLSPQGKILFDFFVVRKGDVVLLETARHASDALARRLAMYKLRADVSIDDVSADYTVAAFWDTDRGDPIDLAVPTTSDGVSFADPRLAAMGMRLLMTLSSDWMTGKIDAKPVTHDDYDELRVKHGVPEGSKDYSYGEAYVHEALFDQLNGVSFSKGCFVGQEVVSRVEHRNRARKRIVPVSAALPLSVDAREVRAGTSVVGTLGTISGKRALANLRLDRVSEALDAGHIVEAGDAKIAIEIPAWATFSLSMEGGNEPNDPTAGVS